jgi:hypothetical protein
MGLYSGGVQIIAGTDAGIDNCPHDAYISGLNHLELVVARGVEHRPAPYRDRRPAGPPPGAEPAVAGPAAAASALATPAGPSSR